MAFTKATFDYLDSGGLINWITTAKTTAFTAVSGEGYLVDTTSAAVTVTLPASPSAGDEIIIVDYASNAATNNITLGRNSLKIRGATDDLVLATNNQSARLLYSGATKGWLVTSDAGAAASGGSAAAALEVSYLIVAGGGGGGGNRQNGNQNSGGGGAGGYLTNYGGTALSLSISTNYTITVGASGAGGISDTTLATNGGNSTFSPVATLAYGGGAGAGQQSGGNAGSGGSGGGGAVDKPSGGTANPTGQGNDGGTSNGYFAPGGGGGGAGAVGQGGTVGTGGIGLTNAITVASGTGPYYAGGGGGSMSSGASAGAGGNGGGGGGSSSSGSNGTNGTPFTGGGGGGAYGGSSSGGSGGSGVVILRYPNDYSISETTSGGNVLTFSTDSTTVSNIKITTFTAGQSGTIQFST